MQRKILIAIISLAIIVIVCISLVVIFVPNRNRVIDTTPPEVKFTNLKEYSMVSGIADIAFSANEDCKEYNLYLDDVLVGNSTESGEFLVSTYQYHDGFHNISAVAIDLSGNVGYANLTICIDNTDDPPRTDKFKIMEYNIYESGILTTWQDVVEQENPDIAVFIETGKWDDHNCSKLKLYTRKFNGYFYYMAHYESDVTKGVNYATSGEAIMSRYAIIDFIQISKLTLDDGSTYFPTHDPFDAVVNISGVVTHIIGVHLKAMYGPDMEARREKEQEGIINYIDNLGNVPIIYIGDFNSNSPDDIGDLAPPDDRLGTGPVTMLLHPNDPIYGNRSSKVHAFIDVYRTLNPNEKGWTFNAADIGRIDFIFVNQFFADYLINSTVYNTTLAKQSSDHYPVDAWLWIPKSNKTGLIRERILDAYISMSNTTVNTIPRSSNIFIAVVIYPRRKAERVELSKTMPSLFAFSLVFRYALETCL